MRPLHDRIIIVTGASSGIGAATAQALARAGATIVLAARREARLAEVQQAIEAAGGRCLSVPTDVTRRSDLENLATRTLEAYGRIDALVNNAGIMLNSFIRNLHVEEWERMIDVNVKGVLYGIAAVLPTMRSQRFGHIVNVSSVAGKKIYPGGTVYSGTKFAVGAISDGLQQELSAADNIRVTVIQPGFVATELIDHITDEELLALRRPVWAGMTPLQPEDIAEAVVYAVSAPPHVNVNEITVRPTQQGG